MMLLCQSILHECFANMLAENTSETLQRIKVLCVLVALSFSLWK